jgi:hypothetical protein
MARARYKIDELITVHNNLAKRKGRRQIPPGAKMSIAEIADRIEQVNKSPPRAGWRSLFQNLFFK